MGAIGTIGHVEATFSADTAQADSGLQSLATKSDVASKKMELAAQMARTMGEAIDGIGPKTERAATVQERSAERMRRAWQQEVLQQNRAIDAEQASSRAKELAALKADILARSLEGQATAQAAVNRAVEGSIPQYAAASGVIRAMEGGMNNNIRAAERFVSTTLGLGPVLQTLFPIAGGLAFLDIIARMTEKVADLVQNWEGVRDAENAAVEAIGKWGQASVEQADAHARMLREQQVTAAELTAPRASREAAGAASGVIFDLAQERAKAADLQDQLRSARESIVRQNLEQRAAATRLVTNFGTAPGPFDPTKNPVPIYGPTTDAQIARDALRQKNAEIATIQGELKNTQAQIVNLQQQADLRKKEIAEGGARTERHDASEQMAAARDKLAAMRAIQAMSLQDEADYWQNLADKAKRGSALYGDALTEANKARSAIVLQRQKEFGDQAVSLARVDAPASLLGGEPGSAEASRNASDYLQAQWDKDQEEADKTQKALGEAASRAFESAERQRQAAMRLQEERIRLQVASGQLSRNGAAVALAALHESSFAQWSEGSASFSSAFPSLSVPGAEQATSQQALQALQDAETIRVTSNLGEFGDGLARTTQSLLDFGAKAAELFNATLGNVNKDIIDSLTMRHPRVSWSNTGATMFRGIANIGLESAEGSMMKALGLGSLKKRQEANVWVQNWPGGVAGGSTSGGGSPIAGVLGKVGSWVASLFGHGGGSGISNLTGAIAGMQSQLPLFPPGFASGGPIPSGMPAIVGEHGPELFVPSSAGHIVPSGRFSAGGAVTHNISIDARGATDPAAVHEAVHRAVRSSMPQIIAATQAADRDSQARHTRRGLM